MAVHLKKENELKSKTELMKATKKKIWQEAIAATNYILQTGSIKDSKIQRLLTEISKELNADYNLPSILGKPGSLITTST